MGLGKTVQVLALIAYLMEFMGNYGPHLIIVPNAVLVNWKSELYNWLPSVSCIFYVGMKDQRSELFSQEVSAMKFNVAFIHHHDYGSAHCAFPSTRSYLRKTTTIEQHRGLGYCFSTDFFTIKQGRGNPKMRRLNLKKCISDLPESREERLKK
ncbi:hypothetical protein RIF29_26141 [Crotalaria pallida]|uniref:SNF2 N-terminal domain-containing protein n=1 Tax=Crotalaria pallida TaxID=3830 RepID=A0AAN9I4N3_CROPI